MKYSGIEWIGEIPDNWKIRKVKQCFYISKEQAHDENPTVLSLARAGVKVRDISNNEGQLAASYDNYNPVQPGDLLLNPMDLYSGANCSLSEVSGVISPAYVNLRKRVDLNPKFFDYYFKTQYWAMAMFAHGKGVSFDNRWTMNADAILNYYLPFPSYSEQNFIVDQINEKLTEIDSLIEIENQQIEKLKEYKQAVITEAVTKGLNKNAPMKDSGVEWMGMIPKGWSIQRFKNLGECRNGLTYSPNDMCSEENGVLVLRSSNIQDNQLFLDDNVYVNTFIKDELYVKKGDILICSRNGSAKLIGKNILIPDGLTASFGAFMMIYRSADPVYLRYILCSNLFFRYLGTFLTVSVNQLTGSNFMNIQFPYPQDSIERELIIKYLNKKCANIDELIEIKKQKIEKLNEYKKSLIYEYVTGKKEVMA